MPSDTGAPEDLRLPGARLLWWPGFLDDESARVLYDRLEADLQWQQRPLRMFGRSVLEPRLTAWYGDPDARYRYSGRDHEPLAWSPDLVEVRDRVEAATRGRYNSALANLYRDGADHLGWHSDDERELGRQPVIASLSLGAIRRMQFRPRPRGPIALQLDLPAGSLLVMAGETQTRYHHRITKTARLVAPRINVTFRRVHAASVDS